jgi:hypothetical protein
MEWQEAAENGCERPCGGRDSGGGVNTAPSPGEGGARRSCRRESRRITYRRHRNVADDPRAFRATARSAAGQIKVKPQGLDGGTAASGVAGPVIPSLSFAVGVGGWIAGAAWPSTPQADTTVTRRTR